MSDLPTGTVTFFFTDIEGSTTLWQKYPAAMPTALVRHHGILNHAVASHNGYVFQIIGDAFCAAFSTATDGLAAALVAQRALRDEPWGETGPIRVRMALHTGAAEVRAGEFTSGEYVSGLTLSRAARLLSAGHGGQILLSLPTAELARDHLPKDTTLRDLGARRLKDLIRPEQIFQVVTVDLPADFLPLKTLDVYPHNLPVQLTSFVGREREMDEIKKLLLPSPQPSPVGDKGGRVTHLLTLTGAGGVGKTRLVLQVAADLIDEFPDGVWFIELAPLSDPALIPQTVASLLGLREESRRPLMAMLSDYLRAKTTLLILDNCEHLIADCAKFADTILHAAPKVKILTTSREALGIAGETAYRVPSLSLPPTDFRSLQDFGSLTQYEAVRLFIERALAVQPDFSVTNANAPAVAQICHRLDGIPLAIELAAARVRVLSVTQIAARLDDRFSLLTGGSRMAVPRHRTLRAAIDWSYNLLSKEEQVLVRRLSVFAGGWTWEAAEAVCTGEQRNLDAEPDSFLPAACASSGPLLDILDSLALKSLVIADQLGAAMRYRMLETIRQYAHEKLIESGELRAMRDRHLDYFLRLAEEGAPYVRSGETAWLDRLETEFGNVRAAWERALESDAELALRLASALEWFWVIRGNPKEGWTWLTRLLPRTEAWGTSKRRARALRLAGSLANHWGDTKSAHPLVEASLAIAKAICDKHEVALTLHTLGRVFLSLGNWSEARTCYQDSQALYRQVGDAWSSGYTTMALGQLAFGAGDYESARALFVQSLSLFRNLGDKRGLLATLNAQGELARLQDDYVRAAAFYTESLQLAREMMDRRRQVVMLENLGYVALHERDYVRARALFEEGLALNRQCERAYGLSGYVAGFAGIIGANGKSLQAAQLLGAVEASYQALGAVMAPADRKEYDHILAAVRAQLDEAAFNAAWAEGRKMTLEQAIEYALQNV